MSIVAGLFKSMAYSFAGSPRLMRLSFTFRLLTGSVLLAFVIGSWVEPSPGPDIPLALSVLAWTSSLTLAFEDPRRLKAVARFVLIFAGLGTLLVALSRLIGYQIGLRQAFGGALELAAAFASASMLARWVRVGELSWALSRLGATTLASLVAVGLSQLAQSLQAYSEAYVAVSLKSGRRKLSSLVKPLLFHTLIVGRELAESLYLYGVPERRRPKTSLSLGEVLLLSAILASLTVCFTL